MAKKISPTLPIDKTPVPVLTSIQESRHPHRQWILFSSLLVLGIIILVIVNNGALGLLKNMKFTVNPAPTQAPIDTFNVERAARYAGLNYTVINAQYATSFADDGIHTGAAIVRLNVRVENKSTDQISIIYYDIARLLAPNLSPIAPTNVHLSVGPQPGTSETGWIDFSVPGALQLNTLQLQLGSTTLGESLVTIPFTGAFNPGRYNDRTSPQSLDINYYFPYYNPQLLIYHLARVDIRYAYRGVQAKAGQQYYVLNFRVDNPTGAKISPGFGYDYIRLIYNDGPTHPPVDSTLPYGFNAGAKGVGGRVAFIGPAGQNAVTLDFLAQYGSGGTKYQVSL